MTIKSFIRQHKVRFAAEWADENLNMTDMPAGSSHWKCTLKVGHRQMTLHFSQGPAICREPTVEDVLECLRSDSSSFENSSDFEGWCGEYGYDTDSRKAEKTYRAIERQHSSLSRLFGGDLSDLYDCEF